MSRNSDTALKVIQGGDLRRRFRRKVGGVHKSMAGVVARSQIRDKIGGRLLLDLAPYFMVNGEDPTALDLFVPGTVTATIPTDGVWDIFFDGTYITGGCVNLIRTVTQHD